MKTLIFHDKFTSRTGAEKMNISIANILSADIITAIWSRNCYTPQELGYHGKITELFHDINSGWIGFFLMKWKFFWSKKITKGYERILFSNEALTACHRVLPGTQTLYYAHSLPHELFDKRGEYMKKVPFFFHEFYALSLTLRKWLYKYELRKVQKIFTNSTTNKAYLEKWSGRHDIVILYPPVNILRYRYSKEKTSFLIQEHNNVESVLEKEVSNYYISLARLEPEKRVERIVHAFIHMPEKSIIILYNEHDTGKESVMHAARGYDNIYFQKITNDLDRVKILGSAVASIAVSQNEDFGSIALESMSCGIPVIAVDEGGYKETVIHEKNGILIPSDFTVYNIMDSVKSLTPEKSLSMREACIERANEFSLENFHKKLDTHIEV